MTIPKISQLRPGTYVNIILKADQRSGRLTSGSISEILTRGDHPRGVKVRLSNGQVGRVQSLSAPSQLSADSDAYVHPSSPYSSSKIHSIKRGLSHYNAREGSSRREGRYALQDDYRQDPTPYELNNVV